VVSVLATGSKGHGFAPGQGDGFVRCSQHNFFMGNSEAQFLQPANLANVLTGMYFG
jgi:hypothetical protein